MDTNIHIAQGRRRPNRLRLVPFKILSLLLYGDYPWLQLDAQGLVVAKLGQMARSMRVSRDRLGEHLQWLVDHGYINELHLGRFEARIRLATPPALVDQLGAEREAALRAIEQQESLRSILAEIPKHDAGCED